MAPLDGKEVLKPTAFDAHEQIVRASHTHSLEAGYQPAEEDESQEYPKAVDHVDNAYAEGHLEPVLVKSAEEEKAYLEAKAAAAKAAIEDVAHDVEEV